MYALLRAAALVQGRSLAISDIYCCLFLVKFIILLVKPVN